MEVDTVSKKNAREKTIARLYELLELQEKVKKRFGIDGYNVFVFGSYVTIHYVEGKSDIDIAIYTEELCNLRKVTMEHLFGTAKENYGFRYTQMSGEARIEMKAGITFACINLKRLTKMK